MTTVKMQSKHKMLYKIEPDDDGYPPISIEGLWVQQLTNGTVILDNIPFYAKGIAPGDKLAVSTAENGEMWFQRMVRSGGASVFRIYVDNDFETPKIREELLNLGLPSEVNKNARLIALEVPASADIRPVLDYLILNQEAARFDFEEGVLRHAIPT